MKLSQIIKDILGPSLLEFGFEYSGKPDPNSWRFSKKKGDVLQYIDIQKSNFFAGIRFHLNTSISKIPPAQGSDFVEMNHFVEYSAESIEDILRQFLEIIKEQGLVWLETMSHPNPVPSEHMSIKLFEDPEKYANDFSKKYYLSFHEDEAIPKLEQIIQSYKCEIIEEDLFFIGAAAFFGEFIRRKFGGEWVWSFEHFKLYPVINNIGEKNRFIFPLKKVLEYWSKPSIRWYSLGFIYKELLRD